MSKASSWQMPAKGQPVMLRTVWAQASRVVRPTSPMMRMTSAVSSRLTKWNWKFSRVVMWPRSQAGVAARHDLGEGVHLVGGHAAGGQLDAHHLVVFLALAVDALLQAQAAKLGRVQFTSAEPADPLLEVDDFLREGLQETLGGNRARWF